MIDFFVALIRRTDRVLQLMFKCSVVGVAIVLSISLAQPAPLAAQCVVPRDQHCWGRFNLGSWKRVRVTTESLDAQGKVKSISTTETTTTLVAVDAVSYTLQLDVVVEVAGRRFAGEPEIVQRGFDGQREGQTARVEKAGTENIKIDGVDYPVDVRKVVIDGGDAKQVSLIHYSEKVAPHLLKRETQLTNGRDEKSQFTCTTEVVALSMPCKVLSDVKSASHVKIVQQRPDSKTVTLEVHCADVPGAVVAHTSKELDAGGKTVRRSTLELVSYGIGTGKINAPLWQRLLHHKHGLFRRR